MGVATGSLTRWNASLSLLQSVWGEFSCVGRTVTADCHFAAICGFVLLLVLGLDCWVSTRLKGGVPSCETTFRVSVSEIRTNTNTRPFFDKWMIHYGMAPKVQRVRYLVSG